MKTPFWSRGIAVAVVTLVRLAVAGLMSGVESSPGSSATLRDSLPGRHCSRCRALPGGDADLQVARSIPTGSGCRGFWEEYTDFFASWFHLEIIAYWGILALAYSWHYYQRYREGQLRAELEERLSRGS